MRQFGYLAATLTVVLTAACADYPTAASDAAAPQYAVNGSFNGKFSFNGLELDGDGASNDVIGAHVRIGGGGANTTCSYSSDNGAFVIGTYYGATWGSQVGSEVLAFCMLHFADLQPNTTRYNYQAYFDNVQFVGGPIGDINAHAKASRHAPYSECVYYSADGATFLGNYGASVGFSLKSDLRDWCALHYPDRTDIP